ncbi:DUF3189 family protein [Neomoorella humiferrea]|uniref:DUF3189 domain-containing protein n=1 Tax=Neomoorella humiferrea TaxID=676965 RepID=A0A2T0AVJ6_9FIRM|nr:DUF3189 family protein [Moorella humiferrea]PRR74681.1 hypothetical protein MOHU_06620 [Moorella humiferrea]
MMVIYHCFGGSHSSVTAAAIHLGLLSRHRLPTAAELLALPYFDGRSRGEEGDLKYMGTDAYGNKVYAVGKKNLGARFETFLYNLAAVIGIPRRNILLLNTSPLVNMSMRIGGFISRRMGLTFLGRPLVVWGTRRAFPRLGLFVAENRNLWQNNRITPLKPSIKRNIIIYACFSGTHAAVVAAALHAGRLSFHHLPDWKELKELPHFDTPEGQGGLRFFALTPSGHAVYTAAVGHDGETAKRAAATFLAAWDGEPERVLWIDVSGRVSFFWRIGAFCRRYNYLGWLGRLFLRWSLARDYHVIGDIVKKTKRQERGE